MKPFSITIDGTITEFKDSFELWKWVVQNRPEWTYIPGAQGPPPKSEKDIEYTDYTPPSRYMGIYALTSCKIKYDGTKYVFGIDVAESENQKKSYFGDESGIQEQLNPRPILMNKEY